MLGGSRMRGAMKNYDKGQLAAIAIVALVLLVLLNWYANYESR